MLKIISATFLCSLLLPGFSLAHSDPEGEVHPEVLIEDGNFSIYFADNTERRLDRLDLKNASSRTSDFYKTYRIVVSPSGEVLKKRHKAELPPGPKLPIALEGFRQFDVVEKDGVVRAVIRLNPRPYMLEVSPRKISHEYIWHDNREVSAVSELSITDRGIAYTANIEPPVHPTKRGANFELGAFYFFWYHPNSKEGYGVYAETFVTEIGNPTRIYHIPVRSNLVEIDGTYYVAWVRRNDGKNLLQLTKLQIGSDPESIPLGDTDWNLSISINRIENKLLVAYHELGKIKFKLIDVSQAFSENEGKVAGETNCNSTE